jgi:HEAT repeat protein
MTTNIQPVTVGVFTTDKELRIKVWDNTLVSFTGVAAEEARGKKIHELFPEIETRGFVTKFEGVLSQGMVESLAPAFHRYLIPCPPQAPSTRFERMLQRTTIAPIVEEGQIIGTLVTIEDVTSRVEHERDLAERIKSPDPTIRLDAVQRLSDVEAIEDEAKLVGVVGDSDWQVRHAAVQGLARRSAPEAIKALLELVREDHRNLAVLNSAIQVLVMCDVDTLPTLIKFLRDEDADLRMQAALALGEQRDKRALPMLLETLNDPNINVRFHVIEALGKLRDAGAAEPLATVAQTGEFFLAFPALDSLRQIGDPSISPRIINLLEVESLREPAAETLGFLGDETVVVPLAELLNETEIQVLPVARALATLYSRFEELHGEGEYISDLTRQAIKPKGIQHLLDALGEADGNDLVTLATVIGWLRGPAVDQVLVRLLGEPSVRNEVLEALAHHGEGVISLLLEQLESDDVETRRAAVSVLGRLGYRRATGPLLKVLENDTSLRIDAANAIARLGDEAALESLLKLIGDPDGGVRQSVVAALNSIGSSKMNERIKPLLRDENPLVRESAAKIAGYFGYEDCADALLECCNDPDERVRKAAVEHLPFVEDDRINDVLARKLETDTPKVRAAVAAAMGNVEVATALTNLSRALGDEDSWVRYFAAQSLGRLGQLEAVESLVELVKREPLNHVKIAALEALGRIGGNEAIRTIEAHLRSEDKDIARVAAQALREAGSRESD